MDSLFGVCDRVAVLVNKGIIVDTLEEIVKNPEPWIQEYFGDPRAVRARRAARVRRTKDPEIIR
jgi:phospholipid/cholesterol/gamma-HCH transport system ATP-binding protein